MAPLTVQIVCTLIARWFVGWKDAGRIGLAVMFLFTGGSHFSSLKHDLAAMIPPPLTDALWLIHLTGVLEMAGAIGLLGPPASTACRLGTPGVAGGAVSSQRLRGARGGHARRRAATSLWLRAPLQVLWIVVLWWTSLTGPAAPGAQSSVLSSGRI